MADKNAKPWEPHLIGNYEWDEVASSLQKMIRRGQEYEACFWGYVFHQSSFGGYLWRRLSIIACEDIGMAQPTALVVANEVFRACETIGFPECQENLAHGVVYLATAKKDRSAYNAYMAALKDVNYFGNLPVPMQIRNAPTKLMKEVGYGKGYDKYTKESLLPEKLKGKKYYNSNT